MNKYLKYILPLLITLLLGWFVLHKGIRWNDLQSILDQAKWSALLLALAFQIISYGAVTRLNQILLQSYDAFVPFGKQLVVQLAMAFIESVVPSASVSGVMLRARLLKPYGVSADIATATVISEGTLIFASVLIPASIAVGFVLTNNLYNYHLLSVSLIIIAALMILTGLSIWQWKTPLIIHLRARFRHWFAESWERHIQVRWPQHFGDWSARSVIQRIHYLWNEAIASLRDHPYTIVMSLIVRFGFEVLCLAMCFSALGHKLTAITLLLVYALTITINTLGALPGGIGLTEVSLSTLYTQLNIPTETAVTIALAYRIVGYWFPRLIGSLAWLWIEQIQTSQSISEDIP